MEGVKRVAASGNYTPRIQSFGISLNTIDQAWRKEEEDDDDNKKTLLKNGPKELQQGQEQQQEQQRGVVGTILLMGRSAMIWIGWGTVVIPHNEQNLISTTNNNDNEHERAIGCGIPSMGPLIFATPRTSYSGMFGGTNASTQLIGGSSEEDSIMATQMSIRLSKTTQWAVFVSSSLYSSIPTATKAAAGGENDDGMMMLDAGLGGTLGQRAAVLAEKRIRLILSETTWPTRNK